MSFYCQNKRQNVKNYEKRKLWRKRRGEEDDDTFFACGLRDVDLIMCNKD